MIPRYTSLASGTITHIAWLLQIQHLLTGPTVTICDQATAVPCLEHGNSLGALLHMPGPAHPLPTRPRSWQPSSCSIPAGALGTPSPRLSARSFCCQDLLRRPAMASLPTGWAAPGTTRPGAPSSAETCGNGRALLLACGLFEVRAPIFHCCVPRAETRARPRTGAQQTCPD